MRLGDHSNNYIGAELTIAVHRNGSNELNDHVLIISQPIGYMHACNDSNELQSFVLRMFPSNLMLDVCTWHVQQYCPLLWNWGCRLARSKISHAPLDLGYAQVENGFVLGCSGVGARCHAENNLTQHTRQRLVSTHAVAVVS